MKKSTRIMSAVLACVMLAGLGGCKKDEKTTQAAFHYEGDVFVPDKELTVKVWQTRGNGDKKQRC